MNLNILKYNCFYLFVFLFLMTSSGFGQDRFTALNTRLTELSTTIPGLSEKVEVSVNGVSIQEFVRGIATANNVDLSIDPTLSINVANSFANASVKDILIYLCKQYELDLSFIGTIINIEKYKAPVIVKKDTVITKKINVSYDKDSKTLSYDLNTDSLFAVARELTKTTGKNYVLTPTLYKKIVSGFIQHASLDNALDLLAYSNNLKIKKTGDNYMFDENEELSSTETTTKKSTSKTTSTKKTDSSEETETVITVDSLDRISVSAVDAKISDIIEEVSKKMNINFFIATDITGTTSVNLTKISYDDLLDNILSGTLFTYHMQDGYYLFGKRDMEGLRQTRVVKLKYRSVENIATFIPADLKKDVDVKEFPELNSVILSGSKRTINEIDSFLFDIDKVVPVVLIEVLIVDSKTGHTVNTGLATILKNTSATTTTPTTTSGTVFPELNVTLNASSLNKIINSLNGFGWINIGKVTSNFYASLQAMEEQGILKVNSTPKLATLNGNEATLSIGNTEYYLEETNNLISNQSTQNITTKQYKSVNADLTLTIKPFVSGDDQITLKIEVKQSDFTARISPSAPPGSVTRSFSSLIRVKNEEMILLGGLEKKVDASSGSGVPVLARIPVIKWFFSTQKRERSRTKLNIFIKPTIVY